MITSIKSGERVVRHRLRLTGCVQGVGFRPFVFRLASAHQLAGHICNDGACVSIEVQGPSSQVNAFRSLVRRPSKHGLSINAVMDEPIPVEATDRSFAIIPSRDESLHAISVIPDLAVCDKCLRELRTPVNRRHRYPLINCTQCGPRYSIIQRVPYDRPNTTMAAFDQCPACRAEYDDPVNRRFHAQPNACEACGPTVQLVDTLGKVIDCDPVKEAARRLDRGDIVAVKGTGGFHLAVDPTNEAAVARLRRLKQREARPFAIMCANAEVAGRYGQLTKEAVRSLMSPATPIVLAPARPGSTLAANVAPGSHRVGLMLPNTPLQHLLLDECNLDALVMTSGNPSNEPLVIDNTDAVNRLGVLCDVILWHDRPIARPVDDSVLLQREVGSGLTPIRRARGYCPLPMPLKIHGKSSRGLSVGAELKNTIAIVDRNQATISQHLGDLSSTRSMANYQHVTHDLMDLLRVEPQWVAHDLHPRYLNTLAAKELARRRSIPAFAIQHHHAHAASLMAEHGETGPILAMVCDGIGYGTDGSPWGGELLIASMRDFNRLAALEPLSLPGFDVTSKEPRRAGMALLHRTLGDDFSDHPIARRLYPDERERAFLAQAIQKGVNCVTTTSTGRLFDAVAAVLDICDRNTFEAQAAMALETAAIHYAGDAIDYDGDRPYAPPVGHLIATQTLKETGTIPVTPIVRNVIQDLMLGHAPGELADWFHHDLACVIADALVKASEVTEVRTIGLTGGVFANERLVRYLTDAVKRRDSGLRILLHEKVPCNDGGISYGQAAIGATWFASGTLPRSKNGKVDSVGRVGNAEQVVSSV